MAPRACLSTYDPGVRCTTLLIVGLSVIALGCGSQRTDRESSRGPTSAADAKPRAGRLLDDWSTTLLTTLIVARARGQAAQTGDQAAYATADEKLRPDLRRVRRFAAQGRAVMSQFPDGSLRRAVVADGDAWQAWGLKLLEPGEVSLAKARRIADLATVAYAKHEEAYRAAGKTPPPAFQRRADQK